MCGVSMAAMGLFVFVQLPPFVEAPVSHKLVLKSNRPTAVRCNRACFCLVFQMTIVLRVRNCCGDVLFYMHTLGDAEGPIWLGVLEFHYC